MRHFVLAVAIFGFSNPARAAYAPVPLSRPELARAEAALGSLPGRWMVARRCWTATTRIADRVETGCLMVVKGYTVITAAGPEIHLLLEGKGKDDCHACAGLAAFAVVRVTGETWRAVAAPVVEPSGSYGMPNNATSINLARLGADRWGWIESTGWFGQGYVEGGTVIHAMLGGRAVVAGQLPGDQGNAGACESYTADRPGCERRIDYTVTATPDGSTPGLAQYPIVLHAKGILGGPIDKQVRVPFSEQPPHYAAPSGWPG